MRKIIILLISALLLTSNMQAQAYKDPKAPVEKRVEDLLSRMTLEQKVGQMSQYVGLAHMRKAAVEISSDELKKSHTMGFYADYPPAKIEQMAKDGVIGSFLHVLSSDEANYLQSLAMQSKLQIPLIIGIDAIHGNALVGGTTVYPTPIGQASTFNPELVRLASAQTAREMRATGSHLTFTPNIDVARDPRWGRVGETFGEDPYLVSLMGVASVKGLQGDGAVTDNVLACVKHLVGGGEPVNGINGAPFDATERTLREIYLPPFIKCIEAQVAFVMPAHNDYNGIPCHGNKYLMQDIVRGEMGFKGLYVSDWMDIERLQDYHKVVDKQNDAFLMTIDAGMDLHMHGPDWYFGVLELVKSGKVSVERIDKSVRMILEHKFRMGLFENPYVDTKVLKKELFTEAHRKTALDMACQSIVLLKNDNLLPLDSKKYKRILVTGPNVDNQSILGDWAMVQPSENVTTIYEGLKNVRPDIDFVLSAVNDNLHAISQAEIDKAVEQGKQCDLAIVAVGENSMRYRWSTKTCGENSDRYDVSLYGRQAEIIERLHKEGVKVVVVLVNGRPLATEWISDNIPALIEAWEPGSFGGEAVAKIIFGDVVPSGKLPMTIVRHSGQIGTYYNYKYTSKWFKYATGKSTPLYPFGFGLSYTTFKYGTPVLSQNEILPTGQVTLSVEVTNTGKYAADEIVQLYVTDEVASATRPVKELKDFRRITLAPAETKKVEFTITPDKLAYYNADMVYGVEKGSFKVWVGGSSADEDLKFARFTVK